MTTEPRVYVASLHDYNAGRLEGKWIDLTDHLDANGVQTEIKDWLKDLNEKYDDGAVREEWAYHDYEGFPHPLYSEYHIDFDLIFEAIEMAEDYPIEAVWAFLEWIPGGTREQFEESYRGEWDSDEEMVQQLLEETEPIFWEGKIPHYIHIDWKATARDIMMDFHEENGHYFWAHV